MLVIVCIDLRLIFLLFTVMDRDPRLSKDFIKAVYYDEDLKNLESSGGKIPSPQNEKTIENVPKNSPQKVGTNESVKLGSKSKTNPKNSKDSDDSDDVDDPDDFDFQSNDSDKENSVHENKVKEPITKKTSASKAQPR